MARTNVPNSACSQFFIMHADAPHLDGSYAAFGKLTEGYDVLDEIANAPTDFYDRPFETQRVKSIAVVTFGKDYPEPDMLLKELGKQVPKENW